jgi:hypothetical protein
MIALYKMQGLLLIAMTITKQKWSEHPPHLEQSQYQRRGAASE